MTTVVALDLGAYQAARAAALSGVPLSTVYDWAKKGVVVPSVSPGREKLWSYGDLLTLRLVRWLRTEKPEARRTAMAEVRDALLAFAGDLWEEAGAGATRPTVAVDRTGTVVHTRRMETAVGQRVIDDVLDLFAPFEGAPDLRQPADRLRIVPGRCAGEPHLLGTRLTTMTVAALADRGYDLQLIRELYPREDVLALRQAVEFEQRLAAAS